MNNSNINSNPSRRSSKKKKRPKTILDVTDDDETVLVLSAGLPLLHTLSYLVPGDVLKCLQTLYNKKWEQNSETEGVWLCEVANSFSLIVVDAILQQQQNNNNHHNDNDNETTTPFNDRNRAIAVSSHRLMSDS